MTEHDLSAPVRAVQRELGWLHRQAEALRRSLAAGEITPLEAERAHLIMATERAELCRALRLLDTHQLVGPVLPLTFCGLPGAIRTRLGGPQAHRHVIVVRRDTRRVA